MILYKHKHIWKMIFFPLGFFLNRRNSNHDNLQSWWRWKASVANKSTRAVAVYFFFKLCGGSGLLLRDGDWQNLMCRFKMMDTSEISTRACRQADDLWISLRHSQVSRTQQLQRCKNVQGATVSHVSLQSVQKVTGSSESCCRCFVLIVSLLMKCS